MNLLRQRLHQRAAFLAAIRAFFAARDVIEVDSEQLRAYGVTDPQLVPLAADGGYLQTSPEYALKILLAWYRCGYDHLRLMDEVTDLVRTLLPACRTWPVRHTPYATLFRDRFAIDIYRADDAAIRRLTTAHIPESATWQLNRDAMLDLLYSHYIEPQLGRGALEYICDYPPSQAALARISENADGEAVAARFELYIDGMELCNGFWELTDAAEQRARFLADNRARVQAGLPPILLDEDFLAALAHGLPDCAGVALGVDRLLMLASGATRIEDVVSPSRL